jgi:hypothetical protein
MKEIIKTRVGSDQNSRRATFAALSETSSHPLGERRAGRVSVRDEVLDRRA